MLIDVNTDINATGSGAILAVIAGGDPSAKKLRQGFYEINHFSFNYMTPKAKLANEYPDFMGDPDDLYAYGVCDSPDQFAEKFAVTLEADPRHFCVSFTKIAKADQSPDGGWRWHKWGPYVGTQERSGTEYLYDEPTIEVVYVYHILEVRP